MYLLRSTLLIGLLCVTDVVTFLWFSSPQINSFPPVNVNKNSVSVSGVSSGAVMAVQYHVAFSSNVIGAGIIGGASTKLIASYYSQFISNTSHIKVVDDIKAAHGMITNNYGGACGVMQLRNFINNCNYSAAYHLLNHIYGGGLKEPAKTFVANGQLLEFDQTPYTRYLSGLDSKGYVYIPTACKDKKSECKLHVAFHGCNMGRYKLGDEYARHAGYNEVGELNNIIILYPQVLKSLTNPLGCWDWTGYTGINYAFKYGPQMASIKSMVDSLIG